VYNYIYLLYYYIYYSSSLGSQTINYNCKTSFFMFFILRLMMST